MQISITDFKDLMLSKAGGKPLAKISNFYSLLFQAMIKVKSNVDMPSMIRNVQLTNAVYTDVHQYSLPTDISLNGIIALRAIEPDDTFDDFKHLNMRQSLIEQKYGKLNRLAIRYTNGIPYLLLDTETTSPLVVNACESLTANGTPAVIGATTAIAVDDVQKISGDGSLTFTVGVGASNGIQITGMTAVDLSAKRDILAYVYLPTLTNVTGIKIGVGQNATAYYTSGTITTDIFGNSLKTGWNLVKVVRTSMTVGAGVPAFTGVVYMRYEVIGTFAATVSDFKIDSVVGQIGALYEIDYYSEYGFKNIAGTYIVKPTVDTDYISLSTAEEINLFTDQFTEVMTADLKQSGAVSDIKVYGGEGLKVEYEKFKFKYPSQRQLATTTWANRPMFDQ